MFQARSSKFLWLRPQHRTIPDFVSPQECAAPVVTCTKSPLKRGLLWPSWLDPQHTAELSLRSASRTAQACRRPAAILLTKTSVGGEL